MWTGKPAHSKTRRLARRWAVSAYSNGDLGTREWLARQYIRSVRASSPGQADREAIPVPGGDLSHATLARVSRRLIPFLLLLYILNFLDRVNVGFAALEMNRDLGFGPEVYGLGAGIFFLGYCLFEVPSNLVLYRTGARLWIARIMVTWGLTASAMMLVHTASSFYALRFLLGVAEAGFFPGIIFYLTYWYPAPERARAYAWFLAAIPVCGVIGGPVSGGLLGLDGRLGLQGWQWLFLLEGVPSVLVGLAVLRFLPDRPRNAGWLRPEEREWLEARLQAERDGSGAARDGASSTPASDGAASHDAASHVASLRRALADPMVWWLGLSYFLLIVPLYGFALWLPQLIKASGDFTNFEVGVITAIPYAVAAVGMVLVGRRSDRTGERYLYLALPALAGAGGFLAVTRAGSPGVLVAALSLTAFGVLGWLGPFWALPTAFLREQAAAGGIALINSMGAFGGFVGPYLIGRVKQNTGLFTPGLLLLAGSLLAAAALAGGLRRAAGRRG
jgi:ACS family tartrate transporter-like MFS transporter